MINYTFEFNDKKFDYNMMKNDFKQKQFTFLATK